MELDVTLRGRSYEKSSRPDEELGRFTVVGEDLKSVVAMVGNAGWGASSVPVELAPPCIGCGIP